MFYTNYKTAAQSCKTDSRALLVACRTNNRKVVGSRPTKVVCITVLTGNHLGWASTVAGRHSLFRAVGSWNLDYQHWWTLIWHGLMVRAADKADAMPALYNIGSHLLFYHLSTTIAAPAKHHITCLQCQWVSSFITAHNRPHQWF